MKGGGMIATEVAEPYAQGLMSVAQAQNLIDRFGEDASFILTALRDSEELKQFLANPLIKPDSKKAVLRQIAGDQFHPYFINFLMLLVDRGRILYLQEICQQYQALLRQLRQTVLAEVISASDLNDGQKDAVRHRVMQMTGAHQVDLETRIDPELIGGVIIKVGSQVVDASLRGQLRRIGLRLSEAT
jgi:F-type H+-transporting ATPase subunit delta